MKFFKKYSIYLKTGQKVQNGKQKTNDIPKSNNIINSVAETSTRETKHHTRRFGEVRFYYTGGPRAVNTPSSEPRTKKGVTEFLYSEGMIKWVCGFAGAG